MSGENAKLAVDYKERIVWLDGEITNQIAKRLIRIIKRLNKLKRDPIYIYIRGLGGNTYACLNIMSEIERSNSPITCIAHEYVASGCFLLIQAANQKLAVSGTKLNFHKAESYEMIRASKRVKKMAFSQLYHTVQLDRLRAMDALQLYWFNKGGNSAKQVFNLFQMDAIIGIKKACQIDVLDGYFPDNDFEEDKKKINKILKDKEKKRH